MKKRKHSKIFSTCIKNYVSILRYTLAVLGVMFLALLIGFSAFFNNTANALATLGTDIETITQNADLSLDGLAPAFVSDLFSDFTENDTNEDGIVSNNETKEAVKKTFETILNEKIANYTDYAEKLGEAVMVAVSAIMTGLVVFLIIQAVGAVAAVALTDFFATMDIEHRNPLKVIGSRIVHFVLTFIAIVIVVLGFLYIPVLGYVLLLLLPVFYCIVSLFSSNLTISKRNRLPIKELLSVKNVVFLLLGDIAAIVISIVIGFIILGISNVVIAFYVALSLIIVTAEAISLNAGAIISNILNNKSLEAQE